MISTILATMSVVFAVALALYGVCMDHKLHVTGDAYVTGIGLGCIILCGALAAVAHLWGY